MLGYLLAFLVLRSAWFGPRFLFAAVNPEFRVVPMSDAAASLWYRSTVAFVGWYAFGYVTILLLRRLGMSFASSQLLAYLLGLGLLAIALRLVWPGLDDGRPRRRDGRGGAGLPDLGRRGANLRCGRLIVAAAADGGSVPAPSLGNASVPGRDIRRGTAPASADVRLGGGRGPGRARAGDRRRHLAAELGLGGGLCDIAKRDTPAPRLLIGALHAVVILLVADLLWKLASTAIDRQLRTFGRGNEHRPETHLRTSARRRPAPRPPADAAADPADRAACRAGRDGGADGAVGAWGAGGPLIAGAGVVGVAIGFGSQTLVKDIISGMFYLLDDAFRVGEYIVSGNYPRHGRGLLVALDRLRHHRGPLFTVPFGMLGAVQNLSRDWVIDKITSASPTTPTSTR